MLRVYLTNYVSKTKAVLNFQKLITTCITPKSLLPHVLPIYMYMFTHIEYDQTVNSYQCYIRLRSSQTSS